MASKLAPHSAALRHAPSSLRAAYAPTQAIPPLASTPLTRPQIQSPTALQHRRHASTAPAARTPDILTWNRFFDLRRKRRLLNLGASIATAGTSTAVFAPMLMNADIDSWAAQVGGLDPMAMMAATVFFVGAGGWMCGPSAGNLLFKAWAGRRGWNEGIAQKEVSFYARIKRFRADPSSSSPQNPIPDYYGEKIGSVKDYRRWLKDQRAFNLKKDKNMI